MRLRASPHCGRVYREKVRAKKNEPSFMPSIFA
jgi:hypothetical protein